MTDSMPSSDGLDRRQALVLGAATLVPMAQAQPVSEAVETLVLWPSAPPGAPDPLPQEVVTERAAAHQLRDRIVTHVARPTLTVFRPDRPNGTAVLIVPGGGYQRVALDKEGFETATWLSARGATAFVLRYRLPGNGWRNRTQVPLQDAQRAMRLIRARAKDFAVDAARVGVIGFSAGGHVAAMLSTSSALPTYAPLDEADRLSAKPVVTGLVYPVISMGAFAHGGSRDELLGPASTPEQLRALSADQQVTAETPPTILFHAQDDTAVPVDNSLLMHAALRRASVLTELHLFAEGGHGFGLRLPIALPASHWPELLARFFGKYGL